METFSALLALCAGKSPVSGEFPSQRPVTRSFEVLFDLRINKRLSKQSWGWWFETPSCSLWRHCNGRYDFNFVVTSDIGGCRYDNMTTTSATSDKVGIMTTLGFQCSITAIRHFLAKYNFKKNTLHIYNRGGMFLRISLGFGKYNIWFFFFWRENCALASLSHLI